MADDAGDFRVDELLRDRGADLRVGLVVLAHHLELDRLAADLDLLGVGFVDGEVHAVLVVLAEVRDAAGERARVADLDGDRSSRRRRRGRRCRRFGAAAFFGSSLPQPYRSSSAAATSVRPSLQGVGPIQGEACIWFLRGGGGGKG